MPDVPKHAWTHRPKSQGGTDPIAFEASSGLPSAIGQSGSMSIAITGGSLGIIPFRWIVWNDAMFGYTHTSGGSPNRARYITVSQEGIYMIRGLAAWDTAFSAGDDTYIQFIVDLVDVATEDTLINTAIDAVLDEWNNPITTIQHDDELDYLALQNTAIVNFTEADFGTSVLGFGLGIGSDVGRTKTFAGSISVTRLGEPGTMQTIV